MINIHCQSVFQKDFSNLYFQLLLEVSAFLKLLLTLDFFFSLKKGLQFNRWKNDNSVLICSIFISSEVECHFHLKYAYSYHLLAVWLWMCHSGPIFLFDEMGTCFIWFLWSLNKSILYVQILECFDHDPQ